MADGESRRRMRGGRGRMGSRRRMMTGDERPAERQTAEAPAVTDALAATNEWSASPTRLPESERGVNVRTSPRRHPSPLATCQFRDGMSIQRYGLGRNASNLRLLPGPTGSPHPIDIKPGDLGLGNARRRSRGSIGHARQQDLFDHTGPGRQRYQDSGVGAEAAVRVREKRNVMRPRRERYPLARGQAPGTDRPST